MSNRISRQQFLRGTLQTSVAGRSSDGEKTPAESSHVECVDIGGKCLDINGTTCRLCEEHCEEFAISFHLMTGGRAVPIIDETSCDGCADCIAICPVGAIHPVNKPSEARL